VALPAGLPADADSRGIDYDQAPGPVLVGQKAQQAIQSDLGFLDGGRPHSQADDTVVTSERKHPGIRKIFIESDDHGMVVLGPGEDLGIGPVAEAYVGGVEYLPVRTTGEKPSTDLPGDILVQEHPKGGISHG
jgi:hypothetical protein